VFLITDSDELIILRAETGELIEKIRISPSIRFYDPTLDVDFDTYQLAADTENQLLYILLGNSNQLFSFRILC